MIVIREYVLSVVSVSLLSSIVLAIAPKKGASAQILKMLTGLAIVITLVHPLVRISFVNTRDYFQVSKTETDIAVQAGKEMAEKTTAEIIKETLESYILDRAKTMDAQVQVNITLSESFTPESVQITGQLSPYARSALQQYIANDIGIAKEQQYWS